jgi:hypothetical protein
LDTRRTPLSYLNALSFFWRYRAANANIRGASASCRIELYQGMFARVQMTELTLNFII